MHVSYRACSSDLFDQVYVRKLVISLNPLGDIIEQVGFLRYNENVYERSSPCPSAGKRWVLY